jgi:hypothetical protein
MHDVKTGRAISFAYTESIAVISKSNHWIYAKFPRIDHKYFAATQFPPTTIKIQVEPDGSIFVLAPGTRNVTTNIPPQPDGFPLHPLQSSK